LKLESAALSATCPAIHPIWFLFYFSASLFEGFEETELA